MDQREFGGLGIVGGGLNGEGLDAVQEHYISSYAAADLKTFHCERVRKMPLSGLDPSMLIGFLCKDELDWIDFRRRVGDVSPKFQLC
jgi:cysteine protease ATG4